MPPAPAREWIGVADVRLTYWRTTDAEATAPAVGRTPDETPSGDSAAEPGDVLTAAPTPVEVTREEAEEAWIPEVHRILTRVAGTYQALIEHAELAAEVQESSGVHTRRQVRSWVGPVLERVARLNHENGEPPLTSLVVHKSDGTVGAGYDEAIRLADGDEPTDPHLREKHAAQARLACYEWAGANTPSGGGRPLLSPRYEQIHARLRKERRAAEQPTICATCFMAIPPTGVCDNCG